MAIYKVFVCNLLLCYSSSSEEQLKKQFDILLENPLENFPLQNMEIDLKSESVYVSGKNILYRLGVEEDMPLTARHTGPEANCLIPGYEEYCGDDYNTVMVVTPDSLITCGTLRGGLCLRRDKEILNQTTNISNIRLVSNKQSSAVGIFLNIRDKSSSGKFENIVLFAKQYTALPLSPYRLEQASIFSVLPNLSLINIGSSKFGTIFDMILKTPRSVIMDYREAIENENLFFFW